ncbi:hypothetical protein EDD18DRAFT_1113982 [Armillaria luteobubalina]|uniref:Uncharacterized protein n=1 Tax=Armillaria luteobubalina TaxID=153913 RepID=A0AA39P7H2_9AGAR|nr:hypothetical protein EDD18DRAFT_1113982 [Armillaria luteobubalina]
MKAQTWVTIEDLLTVCTEFDAGLEAQRQELLATQSSSWVYLFMVKIIIISVFGFTLSVVATNIPELSAIKKCGLFGTPWHIHQQLASISTLQHHCARSPP